MLQFQPFTNPPLPHAFYEYSQGSGTKKVLFESKCTAVYYQEKKLKVLFLFELFSFSCIN